MIFRRRPGVGGMKENEMMDEPQRADSAKSDDAPIAHPEERAFTGHPDHPPATPDQPVDGNEDLIRRGDDEVDTADGSDR
jgi:hypothetical protein